MAFKIIYRKRFTNRLLKLLFYLEMEWSKSVADNFTKQLLRRFKTLSEQPYIGRPSTGLVNIRSILVTKHNRVYYKVKGETIEILNMYDTRSNPRKNQLK